MAAAAQDAGLWAGGGAWWGQEWQRSWNGSCEPQAWQASDGWKGGDEWPSWAEEAEVRPAVGVAAVPAHVLNDAHQTAEAGERLLRRGWVGGALRCFERARGYLEPYLQPLAAEGGGHGRASWRLRTVATVTLTRLAECHLRGAPPGLAPAPALALVVCEECLRLEPGCAEAWLHKAAALAALGRAAEAEAALAEAARLEPAAAAREQEPVETEQVAEVAAWAPSAEELLAKVQQLRKEGTTHFKEGDIEAAKSAYEQGVALLWGHAGLWEGAAASEEDRAGPASCLCAAALALLTNVAQCHLRAEPPVADKALAYCEEALRLEPSSVKALFRKGKALAELRDYAAAYAALTRAAQLDAKDPAVRAERARVQRLAQEEERGKRARFFAQDSDSEPEPAAGVAGGGAAGGGPGRRGRGGEARGHPQGAPPGCGAEPGGPAAAASAGQHRGAWCAGSASARPCRCLRAQQ